MACPSANIVSGNTPCVLHSPITVIGAPADTHTTSAIREKPGAIGTEPVSSARTHRPPPIGAGTTDTQTGKRSSQGSPAIAHPHTAMASATVWVAGGNECHRGSPSTRPTSAAQGDATGVPVEVGFDHRPDVVLARDLVAEHPEREQHRPRRCLAVIALGREPRALHRDAVFACSALAITRHRAVDGTLASTSSLATVRPAAACTPSASASGRRDVCLPADSQGVQERHLFEHVLVPTGALPDLGGDASHPIGETATLGVDESSGDAIPCFRSRQFRRGDADADAIGQPAIELLQSRTHALGALPLAFLSRRIERFVCGLRRSGAAAEGTVAGTLLLLTVARRDDHIICSRFVRGTGFRLRPSRPTLQPLGRERQAPSPHHSIAGVQQQQTERVLARHLATGTVASIRGTADVVGQVDGHVIGLGRGGDVLAPHRRVVASRSGPRAVLGHREGGRRRALVPGERQHLIGCRTNGHRAPRYRGAVTVMTPRRPPDHGYPSSMSSGNDASDNRLLGTDIVPSVLDLIGNTPLVRLKRISEIHGIPSVLAMKMETTNPGGSSKDRPALEMILAAERDGC